MQTFKYQLYPDQKQQEVLWQHANALNRLYNYFLDQKIKAYQESKTSISKFDQFKQLKHIKQEVPILKAIHSQVVQQVVIRLHKTYQAFFKGNGFPKFRSCKNFFGILYPQSGYKIIDNEFHTGIYGTIKFKNHREIKGRIKQVYITSKNNKWFLCVTCDSDYIKSEPNNNEVGIDLGITNLVATSYGDKKRNKRHAKYFDKQINKLKSRRDSKCKRNSNFYKYLTHTIKRLHDVKSRKIKDFLHKVSKNLSSKYDVIYIEDLNLKSMSEGNKTGINRELRNSSLSTFISYLQYKAHQIIKVNPSNTSKTCNKCGSIQSMPLHIREYNCSCGYKEDRDVNAAKNILCLGQAMVRNNRVQDTILETPIALAMV